MARDRRIMSNRTLVAGFLLVSLSFFATSASAEIIGIINPSFELDGDYETSSIGNLPATGAPQGWDFFRPASSDFGQYFGVKTVDGSRYDQIKLPDDTFTAPDGAKVAYFDMGSDGGDCTGSSTPNECYEGDGDYPLGLQQMLSVAPGAPDENRLQAGRRYELKVDIGNPRTGDDYNFDGFGGYRTELLAGTTVIGKDNNTLDFGESSEGTFLESSFFVLSDDLDVSLLGMALGIRLIHKGAIGRPSSVPDSAEWYSSVSFDNVRLTVSPVPVPAAVWLFGSALLGLVGFSKLRKTT